MRYIKRKIAEGISTVKSVKTFKYHLLVVAVFVLSLIVFNIQQVQNLLQHAYGSTSPNPAQNTSFFIASVDTMKDSMDTSAPKNQLTDAKIASDTNLSATLHTTHITVDTFWDYPNYMRRWVKAVRATGKHVWFRIHPNAWEGNNGVIASMTPTQYLRIEKAFILANADLFKTGDIADFCPEAENGKYWVKRYGKGWASRGPNPATDEFNKFIVGVTDIADQAFVQLRISGVTTTIHSTNAWWPLHPKAFYNSTVKRFGHVTIDTYPDSVTTDPATATKLRVAELIQVWNARHVPIILGEYGYNIKMALPDSVQAAVIKAELSGMGKLPYLMGINYWVSAGLSDPSRLFAGTRGKWSLRPAAKDLANFYATKISSNTQPPPVSITIIPNPMPPSPTPSNGTTIPSVTPPSGETVTVAADGSGNYTTINQAVAALGTQGGTINVMDGTYPPASLNSNTWLSGQGTNVLIQTPPGSTENALNILNAQNVRVTQIRVTGNWNGAPRSAFTGKSYVDGNGIRVYNSSAVYLDNNYANNAWYGGITIDNSTNIALTNNLVEKNRDNNIFLRPNNSNVDIEYNTTRNGTYSGIQCLRSDYVTIANNTSYQNGPSQGQGDGIGSEGCRYMKIDHNTIYGNNPQGVKVDYTVEGGDLPQRSLQVSVTNNTIYDQTVGNNAGILIERADETYVSGNKIYNNYYGMNIGSVGKTTITGNSIFTSIQFAIRAFNVTAVGPISVTNNNLCNNAHDIMNGGVTNFSSSNNACTNPSH
jgi:parallel beta-helix repeat protein